MNVMHGLFVIGLVPATASALVRHVPAEYGTIQAALDASAPGDVVRVAPGTYAENLSMPSSVILESEAGPQVTIIDGSSAGSVIECIGVSPATEIRGFHITNGIGSAQFNGRYGGGILCWSGASPLIEGNILAANTAKFGGAIGCRYSSHPTIRDNEIRSNTASFEGGGIYAIDGGGAAVTIESNVISQNRVVGGIDGASGGGIWAGAIDVSITGNRIEANSAASSFAIGGGGGLWLGFAGNKTVTGNVVLNNTHDNLGGGTWLNEGMTTFANNTLYGNEAPAGGGIATGGLGTKFIRRNIVAASNGIGLHCSAPGTTFVGCNDLWENTGGNALPADCVVDEGGNFVANPLFCNDAVGDLTLGNGSPCLPGGNACAVLIGALSEGCGTVAIMPASWSSMKALYR